MASSLARIFKGSDGQWNWRGIGTVIAAVASGIFAVVKLVVEHYDTYEKPNAQLEQALTGQLGEKDAQIKALMKQNADLTDKLLAQHPAVGPAVQQEVGAAVASIAQGAEAGDSRLEKALSLLKKTRLADATQLLTAFASDKQEQAEKNRKEAATAYRNLGAITGLADPKRALEAYEKALVLDSDDIKSLLWAGWIQIDYGDLNKAQTRLERVLKLAETNDQPFYEYWALTGLGDIKQTRGDLPAALKDYQDSLGIADRLAKADPGNAQWQRDLSASYNKVGDVQRAQSDLAGG